MLKPLTRSWSQSDMCPPVTRPAREPGARQPSPGAIAHGSVDDQLKADCVAGELDRATNDRVPSRSCRHWGIRDIEVSRLAFGLASHAWLVMAGEIRQVLRVASYSDDPMTYPAQHAVMTRLRVAGAPVPEPVAGSWQLRGWQGPAFSLTTWLPGTSLQPYARGHRRKL
jgi:hypothetical protein